MKFCEYCGEKIIEGDLYCLKCGNRQENVSVVKSKKTGTEGLSTASLVLGIISLVLSFIINIFILPLALIGLILGIVGKVHNGRKYSGIVLNVIAMIVAVIVFILWIVLFVYVADNYDENNYNRNKYGYTKSDYSEVIGTWNCKSVNSILSGDYDLVVTLNSDKSFTIGKYNNVDKDYYKGVYYFEDDDLNSYIKNNRTHTIGLNSLEKYEHGDLVNKWDDTYDTYKMIVTRTKDKYHAVLAEDENGKVYYCNK